MQILLKEHRSFVSRLIEAKVEFILIGGYAVIFHGYPRSTDDLDVWLKPDNDNKEKLIAQLQKEDILSEDVLSVSKLDFTKHQAFHFGEPPERIDFLTMVSGLNFEQAQKEQAYFQIEEHSVPVLQLQHLIISKMHTDRMQDKADIEELQKISDLKKKE